MSQQDQSAPWPSPTQGWYVVSALFVAHIFSAADRTILALLVQPIRTDLGLSDTSIGLLHGFAFVVFYVLAGVPLARIADRYSRVGLISIGISLWSLATAACGLATSFWKLALGRVMVGIGEATLSPAAYSLIADYFPPDRRARASGAYAAAAFFGHGITFLVGGYVVGKLLGMGAIEVPVIGTMQPWQLTFVIVGLPGMLVAVWVRTLREPVRREVHTTDGTISEVSAFLQQNRRLLIAHFLGFSCLGGAFISIMAWLPTYFIRVHGFETAQAGLTVGSVLIVFSTSGAFAGGWLADTLRRRGYIDGTLRVGVITGICIAPFGMLLGAARADWLAIAALCPLFFFATFPFGSAAAALQQVAPNRMRAQIISLYILITNLIGAGFGPLATGLLTDHVFGSPQAVGTSIATVSALAGLMGAGIISFGLRPFRDAVAAGRDDSTAREEERLGLSVQTRSAH